MVATVEPVFPVPSIYYSGYITLRFATVEPVFPVPSVNRGKSAIADAMVGESPSAKGFHPPLPTF
jgi:hypothetical protein